MGIISAHSLISFGFVIFALVAGCVVAFQLGLSDI